MKKYFFILFFLCAAKCFAQYKPFVLPKINFKSQVFSIVKYGAKPNGFTLNTSAIQNAIDDANAKGGGNVVIPKGLWLTGPLVLKSNVNLQVQAGATLLFTKDFNQYKLEQGNWEGMPQMRNQSPISATNATNIAITGKGIIDGNGDAWRAVKKDKLNETQWKRLVNSGGVLSDDKKNWYPTEKSKKGFAYKNPGEITLTKTIEFYDSVKDFLRPNMLVLNNCKNILLQDVTFQNSPAWCLHPLLCENILVKNITVKNPWYAQNGDGIDVESSKNVVIENSVFDVGDDALCMKSGRDEAGRKRGKPTENVFINNCTVYAAHGGFVIGSEMSGGVKNVSVNNCTFIGTDIGLRFKSTRGRGGVVKNIYINNIFMKDIVAEAILFDMYYAAKDPIPLEGEKRELPKVEFKTVDETTPLFQNFVIENVYCNGADKAIFIRGIPEMHVKNIVLNNMLLQASKGIDIQEASNITLNDVTVLSKETKPVVEVINSDGVKINGFACAENAEVLIRISGNRNRNNGITNLKTVVKEKVVAELGATADNFLVK